MSRPWAAYGDGGNMKGRSEGDEMSNDDADRLGANIAELQRLLDAQTGLSPEARVTGLAALVNAKTTLRLLDELPFRVGAMRDDVAGPLAHALREFSEVAPGLAAGLRRLPDR